ncbi:MAG TPA: hypothetical protein VJ992_04240 [Gemmatimonadales bacterium]|nr:hypothetical protein [Gemmatimonadales bacterium]
MRTHDTWFPIRRATLLVALLAVALPTDPAAAIPAFARRYGVSCNLCHNPIPRLTPFGLAFAGNGFRFAANEPPRDTVNTGDPLLDLARALPLAVRLDAYAQLYANGKTVTDFQTPYGLKLLAGGTISKSISYYFYFFLFERGEVGGVEDAFVYVNDIGGAPIDVAVGQFQVSDPLFKRELRLEVQDYAIYRARIGLQPTDLTYDRGIMASADFAGFTLTGELVNGNGKGPAQPDLHFDNDAPKNVMGHLSRDIGPNLRLGVLGYRGLTDGTLGTSTVGVTNTVWMVGGDATVTVGPVEVNGQFIHREDDVPNFVPGEPKAVTNGGFAELVVAPPLSRWYGIALYNRITANLPLLDVRLGGAGDLTKYQAVTGGLGYLVQRNLRVYGEATWDTEAKTTRFTAGLTTAF